MSTNNVNQLNSTLQIHSFVEKKYSNLGIDFDYESLPEYIELTENLIKRIIFSVSGKNVAEKRIDALVEAGFNVSDIETKWNFGKTGTIKKITGKYEFQVQIAYATGGRSKNGYGVNACPVVIVS